MGTIIFREDPSQQPADPVATSPHQLPTPAPQGPWDGNSSQNTDPTLVVTIGTGSYPDDTENLKGQNIGPRSLNLPTPPPRITANLEPQTVGDATPNPESHSVATAVPNTSATVKHHGWSPDDPEPGVVRRFFISASLSLTGRLHNIYHVVVSY